MLVKYWNLAFFMVLLLTWQIDLWSTYKTKIDQSSNNLNCCSISCLNNPGGPCCMNCAWRLVTPGATLCRVKCSYEERHWEPSWGESRTPSLMLCSPPECAHRVMETQTPIGSCSGTVRWIHWSFSRGTSQPREWTQVSRIAGVLITNWATREDIHWS